MRMKAPQVNEFSFSHRTLPISDLKVDVATDKNGHRKVTGIDIGGERFEYTPRFGQSLCSRYGFNDSIFTYFDHEEVFTRIMEKRPSEQMRVCVEHGPQANRLLAVSNPKKPIVDASSLLGLVQRFGSESLTYSDGIVESIHTPRNAGGAVTIGPDAFHFKFQLACPVDGYGLPNVYLAMLRMLCQNGIVGLSKCFRSTIALGKAHDEIEPSLVRMLDSFNNEEGYSDLVKRLDMAQKSWASVGEAHQLYQILTKLYTSKRFDEKFEAGGSKFPPNLTLSEFFAKSHERKIKSVHYTAADQAIAETVPLLEAFDGMTGGINSLYGVANVAGLSSKRQRTLPVQCKVYDLINFATEVATHFADAPAAKTLNGYVGSLITDEYDLEGTGMKIAEFKDFHVVGGPAATSLKTTLEVDDEPLTDEVD